MALQQVGGGRLVPSRKGNNEGNKPNRSVRHLSFNGPDWASMCKHVAAVLYGIGARLDKQPELLFTLHKVDQNDLITKAGGKFPLSRRQPNAEKILGSDDLSELFGLDLVRNTATSTSLRNTAAKPPSTKTRTGMKKKGRA